MLQVQLSPALLGEREDVGQWVGTVEGPTQKYVGLLHRLKLLEDASGNLVCHVQLFADSETPSYAVVLGKLESSRHGRG